MKPNISKFSWAELFSNNDGKTSGSGFSGVVICLVGTFCFLLGCIDKMFLSSSIDVITQSIIFVGLGAALLGVRKVTSSTQKETTQTDITTTNSTSEDQPIQQINS